MKKFPFLLKHERKKFFRTYNQGSKTKTKEKSKAKRKECSRWNEKRFFIFPKVFLLIEQIKETLKAAEITLN